MNWGVRTEQALLPVSCRTHIEITSQRLILNFERGKILPVHFRCGRRGLNLDVRFMVKFKYSRSHAQKVRECVWIIHFLVNPPSFSDDRINPNLSYVKHQLWESLLVGITWYYWCLISWNVLIQWLVITLISIHSQEKCALFFEKMHQARRLIVAFTSN